MNFYEVLNVATNATEKEIKRAYRLLAKKYHPDTYLGDKDFAQSKMQEINEAYDTLSDATLRNKYDEKIGVSPVNYQEFRTKTASDFKNKYNRSYNRAYNKAGVNYEVRYRPNNTGTKYDSRGYAESNYYTTNMDDEESFKKYDYNFKKQKIKELFSGKNLVYTLVTFGIVIFLFSLTIYKAVQSINQVVESTQANINRVNRAEEIEQEQREKEIKELKDGFSTMLEGIKRKEQEFINRYEEYEAKTDKTEERKEILRDWGITDSETQQKILDFIEESKKN